MPPSTGAIQPLRAVLLGAPASGKGTQAERIAQRYAVQHIASGEILRAAAADSTERGAQIARLLQAGELVPDDMVANAVCDRVLGAAATGGYLLDGFPRTVSQARRLDEVTGSADAGVTCVLYLEVDEGELLARMRHRATVEQRSDDNEPTMRRRLGVFAEETRPVVDHYAERGLLQRVDGGGELDEVTACIFAVLGDAGVLAGRP